jgi:predicted phage baseplate assembly protein
MPLDAPNLDDRRFADIVDEARSRIPNYLPEWTDHNLSDPGMTLVQLFAWMSEMILYRLNKVPELHYIKFLQLIGVERKPAAPAHAEITFNLVPGTGTVIVPKGTRIGAIPAPVSPSAMTAPTLDAPPDDEPPVFETDEPLIALGGPLKYVLVFDGGLYADKSTSNGAAGQWYAPFGNKLRVNSALYLGIAALPPFPSDEMNLTIRVHSDPRRLQARQCDGAGAGSIPPAVLAWEYFDGMFWRALDLLEDETNALTQSGHLYFRGPSKAVQSVVAPIAESVFWLRCRIVTFQYERPPELDAVVTNTVRATAVSSVRDEVLGSSDGSPDQVFRLRHAPVYAEAPRAIDEPANQPRTAPPTVAEQQQLDDALNARELAKGFVLHVDAGQGFVPWEEVEDFFGSGPEDRHYVLNRTTGQVRFGNRTRGAIPIAGLNNILIRSYRYGGGAKTNSGVGAIKDLLSPVPGVESVTNRWVAEGGQDEERVDDTRARAPQELKARNRAVTLEDFEFLARQTPGVRIRRSYALALYHPRFPDIEVPGAITVIVIPDSDDPKPLPSESTMKAVCAWLDSKRLLTSEVFVAPPRYKLIRIAVRLVAKATSNAARVKAETEAALTGYLHPLTGGDDGDGWPLGGPVRASDLFRVVFQVDGVATVEDLRIVIDGDEKGLCHNADIPKDFLVYSLGHDVSVILQPSGA